MQVGERLIVFNIEGSARVIGGVAGAGGGGGRRTAVGPLRTRGRDRRWKHDPGRPVQSAQYEWSPALWNSLNIQNKATPITALNLSPDTRPSLLSALLASGELTAPIDPMPEFLYGGTALDIAKKLAQPASQEVSEFSRKDLQVWVYSMWTQRGKLSKGMVSAKVYDEQNRQRVNVAPKKVSLYSTPTRSAFAFAPAPLSPGVYRIDVIWDERPVWRTFIRITD